MDAIFRLIREQRLPEARDRLRELVHEQRRNAAAWLLLGRVNTALAMDAEAAACFEKVIALEPGNSEAHYRLGNVRAQRGDREAAIACYRKALSLQPRFAEAACNLGLCLQDLGRVDHAITVYREFLKGGEPSATLCFNLAHALAERQAMDEAISWYERALELDPSHTSARLNLGAARYEKGEVAEAAALYRQALAADPGSAPAARALGEALSALGEVSASATAFRQALAIAGDDTTRLRVATLLPAIPASLDDLRSWRARFDAELSRLESAPLRLQPAGWTNFYLSYHGLNNRDLQVRVADLWRRSCPGLTWTAPHCERPRRAGKIRVGFVSRHLYNHSVGRTTEGLVARLSRERFEVTSLFVAPFRGDEIANRIRAASDRSLTIPVNLDEARRAIAELELDVLFYQDIGMEPFSYMLAFSRLAPVQCAYFGHPDTSGISTVDWFISGELFETAAAPAHYSERLFLLRDVGNFSYYPKPEPLAAPQSRDELGLPAGARLYLCPQTLFKFHPEFDAILAAILRTDAKAVVLLARAPISRWTELLQARFKRSMPDVAERIVFVAQRDHRAFLNLLRAVDVVLDTVHFNGYNSNLEAFAVGAPIVTLPGEFQRGRHTAGMYRRMGLAACIAADADDYARIAVRLATEPDFRRQESGEILARHHVLYEDARVVREFERAFQEMLAQRR